MNPTVIAAALAGAAAVFFAVQSLVALTSRRKLTRIERAQLRAEEQQQTSGREPLGERLQNELRRRGYPGDLASALSLLAGIYLAIVLVTSLLGIPDWIGVIVGLPLALGFGQLMLLQRGARRREQFTDQLTQLLEQLDGQMTSGGYGLRAAFNRVAPGMPEPMRGELLDLMQRAHVEKTLTEPLKRLAAEYPSSPMEQLVTAVELHEQTGAPVGSAIRQAAEMQRRTEKVASEARSALAQAKQQFYGVMVIVSLASAYQAYTTFTRFPEVLTNPFMVGGLALLVANYLWGGFRISAKLRREL